jgi:hypothetical protein
MPKNSRIAVLLLVLAVLLSGMVAPTAARAYDFNNQYGVYDVTNPANTINPATRRVCAIDAAVVDVPPAFENRKKFGLTKRIVLCIKESILAAVKNTLVPFANFFSKLIAVMCVLAVIIWSFLAIAGRRSAHTREVFTLAVKIGLVLMFTANFGSAFFDPDDEHGGFYGLIMDAMEELLGVIVGYAMFSPSFAENCPALATVVPSSSPLYVFRIWDIMDCSIEMLVGGIFSPLTLSSGLVGFLVAALVSNPLGLFIGLLGFGIIIMLLFAIARAVYIFITGYIAFALMVLVSPMFIPLILFKGTIAYFEKWLKVTIGFLLQPIFTFAYLAMLLAAYDVVVVDGPKSLFRSITGSDYEYAMSIGIGQWVLQSGSLLPKDRAEVAVNLNYNKIRNACAAEGGNTGVGNCDINDPQIKKRDTGVLGTIGEEVVDNVGKFQRDIYDVLGNQNIFKTGVPVTGIEWDYVLMVSKFNDPDLDEFMQAFFMFDVCRDNPGMQIPDFLDCFASQDPMNYEGKYYYPYIIGIALSAFMAVVVVFIFMSMLQYLPFIGSGISGEVLSMPQFGAGGLAMPGTGMMNRFQKNIAGGLFNRE